MENKNEIWKVYPWFPFIEASNLGRIRTKDRFVPNGKNSKRLVKGRVLKQRLYPCGYMYVQFSLNGKHFCLRVHRIVATCFIPNPLGLPEVNHKDNDPTNNAVSNLEWCTRQYNEDYKKNFGTSQAQVQGRVLGHSVIAVNLETFEVFWFKSQHEAGRQLEVWQESISAVVKGKQDKTHGWWFCNADENAVEKARSKFGDEIAEKVEDLIQNQN